MAQSKSDIIRRYFDAYRSNDRLAVEKLLTDDFRFTSPTDDAINKATYFARCWPNHKRIKEHVIEKTMEDDDSSFVLYRVVASGSREFRNAELFTFEGARVRAVQVFFGATYKKG